jgi:SAM-dependent methyltransferase
VAAAPRANRCALCAHEAPGTIVNRIARNNTPQVSVACSRCAFVQVSPMPSEGELREYYASGRYRVDFPSLRTEEQEETLAREGAEWLAANVGIVPGCGALEIGCGYGRVAALTGASAIELDPDMRAEAISRGVNVLLSAAERFARDEAMTGYGDYAEVDETPEPGDYSVVYAMQVLEHQPDPVATLREWRSYLASNGRIHVQVPTLEAMYGGAAHWFQYPHVVSFTERTLRIALRMAGFDGIRSGIGDHVLFATATLAEPVTYEVAASEIGPPDDVIALIARHEAAMADRRPSDVERWLSGESASRPSDAALRHALTLMVSIASTGMDGVARLAQAAEHECEAGDAQWSLDPWVLGYQAGTTVTHQRYQQALAHLANALRVRATKETRT